VAPWAQALPPAAASRCSTAAGSSFPRLGGRPHVDGQRGVHTPKRTSVSVSAGGIPSPEDPSSSRSSSMDLRVEGGRPRKPPVTVIGTRKAFPYILGMPFDSCRYTTGWPRGAGVPGLCRGCTHVHPAGAAAGGCGPPGAAPRPQRSQPLARLSFTPPGGYMAVGGCAAQAVAKHGSRPRGRDTQDAAKAAPAAKFLLL